MPRASRGDLNWLRGELMKREGRAVTIPEVIGRALSHYRSMLDGEAIELDEREA
jgi:hypothetical protein